MADVERRTASHFNNVIDLTLSDNDDDARSHLGYRAVLPSRLPATTPRRVVDTSHSNHGLLLEGTFRPSRHGFRSTNPHASRRSSGEGFANAARLKELKEQSQNSRPDRACSPKRRRVDRSGNSRSGSASLSHTEPLRSPRKELEVKGAPEPTAVDTLSLKRTLRPNHQSLTGAAPTNLPSEASKMSGPAGGGDCVKTINERLIVVLRQQVFPYINKCLSSYRRSIDNLTRKQLGKKTAHELCDEAFMEDLERNNSRLSPGFEANIATRAEVLVDRLAGQFLTMKWQDNTVTKIPTTISTKITDRSRTGATSLVGVVPSVVTSQRLSTITKARRASSGMDSLQLEASRMELKSSVTQSISKAMEQPSARVQPLVPIPVVAIDSSSSESDSNDDDLAVARESSKTTPISAESNNKQPKLEPSCSVAPRRRSLRQRPVRESTQPKESIPGRRLPGSKAVLNTQPTKKNHNNGTLLPKKKPLVRLATPTPSVMERYKLRLASLDSSLPRPYLSTQARMDIEGGLKVLSSKYEHRKRYKGEISGLQSSVFHVDFCEEEIEYLIRVVKSVTGEATSLSPNQDVKLRIKHLMASHEDKIPKILSAIAWDNENRLGRGHGRGLGLVQSRSDTALTAFLQDAAHGLSSGRNSILYLHTQPKPSRDCSSVSSKSFDSILRQREIWGTHRNPRSIRSFKTKLINAIEDEFVREAEWTDCSGDIATISWIPGDGFFCGATCHSDEHNMQYNKPGNLLVGSVNRRTLHSISGHQVVRPIVTKGENSRASMRGTQDPWMYCSVTSTAYSYDNQKCFTGSYDQTVKVWNITDDQSSMELCGTWEHAGNVNFVVASPHHGMIATAADVSENAVRVYHFNPDEISASHFDTYEQSCPRRSRSDTWAYFPATMQWGKAACVSHLLLVGYSPRSFNCQDADIPEDKSNTGELCLWNARERTQIPITTARTQNVFEVIWHPSQPIFISATSPAGEREDRIRTQLRIFGQTETGSFCHMKTLDCPAADINEITVVPNSSVQCYVTASCTDGNTYVWDSAQCDRPIHVLPHGPPIDDQAHDLEREDFDVGVKFAAWGKACDRFYTGSSDGVVKAWNIRSPVGEEFIRNVVTLSGGISAGAFSPDFSKLVIGDSTGKVHLLSTRGEELGGEGQSIIRQPVTPHAPLPPPLVDEDDMEIKPEQTAGERAHEFLERGQIILHNDKYIGAIQGPNYASTGFFCPEGHKKGDTGKRVLSEWRTERKLRYHYKKISIPILPEIRSSNKLLHKKNIAKDLDLSSLTLETLAQLQEDGVDLELQHENTLLYRSGVWFKDKEVVIKREHFDTIVEEAGLSDKDCSFDDFEILEFQKLGKELLQELTLRRSLDLVLKKLELDFSKT